MRKPNTLPKKFRLIRLQIATAPTHTYSICFDFVFKFCIKPSRFDTKQKKTTVKITLFAKEPYSKIIKEGKKK